MRQDILNAWEKPGDKVRRRDWSDRSTTRDMLDEMEVSTFEVAEAIANQAPAESTRRRKAR